jgi:hypothetical protein
VCACIFVCHPLLPGAVNPKGRIVTDVISLSLSRSGESISALRKSVSQRAERKREREREKSFIDNQEAREEERKREREREIVPQRFSLRTWAMTCTVVSTSCWSMFRCVTALWRGGTHRVLGRSQADCECYAIPSLSECYAIPFLINCLSPTRSLSLASACALPLSRACVRERARSLSLVLAHALSLSLDGYRIW